jgi:XTP/dITP diphosphohydrolase
MKIIFATNNPNKLAEIRQSLGDHFELLSLEDIGFSGDIPETGRTLEHNALQKAEYIFERYHTPVFADDTGLAVKCLSGAPGVDTAHYSGSRDATDNMEKLLREMEPCDDRSAQFRTVVAFISKEHKELFTGTVEGKIAKAITGNSGFGYDPIFMPEGKSKTFAQMAMTEKAETNHRVRALAKFTAYLKEYV